MRRFTEDQKYFKVYDSLDDKNLRQKFEISNDSLRESSKKTEITGPHQLSSEALTHTPTVDFKRTIEDPEKGRNEKANKIEAESLPIDLAIKGGSQLFHQNVIFEKSTGKTTDKTAPVKKTPANQNLNFQQIIANNMSSVRKKNSVVLSKVNRWDKCFESGNLKPEYWDEDFLST